MGFRALVCCVGCAVGLWVWAEDPGTNISELGWMVGYWQGEVGDALLEEVWLAPSGGSMVGVNRTVAGDRTVAFEYLRLEQTDKGTVYLASPGGRCPATPFRLVEFGDRRAVFANPEHGFPQRVIYWREGNELHARIEGGGPGQVKAAEWKWHLRTLTR